MPGASDGSSDDSDSEMEGAVLTSSASGGSSACGASGAGKTNERSQFMKDHGNGDKPSDTKSKKKAKKEAKLLKQQQQHKKADAERTQQQQSSNSINGATEQQPAVETDGRRTAGTSNTSYHAQSQRTAVPRAEQMDVEDITSSEAENDGEETDNDGFQQQGRKRGQKQSNAGEQRQPPAQREWTAILQWPKDEKPKFEKDVDPQKVLRKELCPAVIELKDLVKLKRIPSGNFLVIVNSEAALTKLTAVETLLETTVTVIQPQQLRQEAPVRGVIHRVPPSYSVAMLKDSLSDYGVIDVEKFGHSTALLKFPPGTPLPPEVLLHQRHVVHEYAVRPRQCHKCLNYHHSAKECTSKPHCKNCGLKTHPTIDCKSTSYCNHCDRRGHRTGATTCRFYIHAREIVKVMQKDGINIVAAKKKVGRVPFPTPPSQNSSSQPRGQPIQTWVTNRDVQPPQRAPPPPSSASDFPSLSGSENAWQNTHTAGEKHPPPQTIDEATAKENDVLKRRLETTEKELATQKEINAQLLARLTAIEAKLAPMQQQPLPPPAAAASLPLLAELNERMKTFEQMANLALTALAQIPGSAEIMQKMAAEKPATQVEPQNLTNTHKSTMADRSRSLSITRDDPDAKKLRRSGATPTNDRDRSRSSQRTGEKPPAVAPQHASGDTRKTPNHTTS
jgi:hypothetical protein